MYCAHVLHNIHGYENYLSVMKAKALNSYCKQANNNIDVSVKMPNSSIL